jgi:hypothetical protein
MLQLTAATLFSGAFLALAAMVPIPPDTCELQVQQVPAGWYFGNCSGYCINATCVTKVTTAPNGFVDYECVCRTYVGGSEPPYTDRQTSGTNCRGVFTRKANGSPVSTVCKTDTCSNPCVPNATLPGVGSSVPACTCP